MRLELIQSILDTEERTELRQFLNRLHQQEKRYLLRNEILIEFVESGQTVFAQVING